MASSKVMVSTSPTNPDLPRRQSSSSLHSLILSDLHSDPTKNFGSMNMDDLFKNIYADPETFPAAVDGGRRVGAGEVGDGLTSQGGVRDKTADEVFKNIYADPNTFPAAVDCGRRSGAGEVGGGLRDKTADEVFKNIYSDPNTFPATVDGSRRGGAGVVGGGLTSQGSLRDKTADEVWKEIMSGSGENMTLEDYLTKEGAIGKEDVVLSEVVPAPAPGYAVDSIICVPQFQPPVINMQSVGSGTGGFGVDSVVGFGNGIVAVGGGGSGRGKRRAVEEPPVDRATQQKQKRMIKNRESAARSRERKQAYTVELESLVTQLEEENARLMREEEELTRERFKQLMENLIPVVEKRRPPRFLRRMNSL